MQVDKPFVKSKQIAFVPLVSANDVIKPNDVAVVSGWGRLRVSKFRMILIKDSVSVKLFVRW